MILAIAIGGAVGSVLRYLITVFMRGVSVETAAATFLVNIVGCFAIGVLARVFAAPTSSPVLRAALMVGVCGGFTTFSTYSLEFITMLQQGREARAAVYLVSSVVVGVLATVLGLLVGSRLVPTT